MSKTSGFRKQLFLHVPRIQAFDAVATLEGLQKWWTPLVSGSPLKNGELRFDFPGLDEHILMRVQKLSSPSSVQWRCLTHTDLPEWEGTSILFDFIEENSRSCRLNFQHLGLTSEMECFEDCKIGWNHFLNSFTDYVEQGKGMPFGE